MKKIVDWVRSKQKSKENFDSKFDSIFAPDIYSLVLHSLSVNDLLSCMRVCKRWNSLSTHDSIWKVSIFNLSTYCKKEICVRANMDVKPDNTSWKDFYLQRHQEYRYYLRLCPYVQRKLMKEHNEYQAIKTEVKYVFL